MPDIPLSSIDRLIRQAGATRVKKDSTEVLRNIAEDFCYQIAKKALEITHHRKNTTITAEDIRQAYRLLFR